MKRAVSNLFLPAFDHYAYLHCLADRGIEGLEIAPFHTWPCAQQAISTSDVKIYRRAAEVSNLQIIGLHSLTVEPLEIAQLDTGSYRARTLAQFTHLSNVCRDLGGRSLIIEKRTRGGLSKRAGWIVFRNFMEELLDQVAPHGTVFCLAPEGQGESDFCAIPRETFMLANSIDDDAYGIHLSTRGLTVDGRTGHRDFCESRGRVELFHIEEPNRAELGTAKVIDHADLRVHLLASGYKGWISVVQNVGNAIERLGSLERGLSFFERTYFPYDLKYCRYDLLEELYGSDSRISLQHGSSHPL
jgi:sugar phosphate isomerase/epimerase